jgi:hypothetical protein
MARRKSARSHCHTTRIIFDNPFSPLVPALSVIALFTILAYSPGKLGKKKERWGMTQGFGVDLGPV